MAGSSENRITLWDVTQKKAIATLESPRPVNAVRVSPNGTLLLAAGDGGGIRVWQLPSRKHVADLPQTGSILDLSFSKDGARLASLADGSLKVWDVAKAVKAHPPK